MYRAAAIWPIRRRVTPGAISRVASMPSHARHADVHDDHVGAGVPGEPYRLGSGSGLAGHVDIWGPLDQPAQSGRDARADLQPGGLRAAGGPHSPASIPSVCERAAGV
jgi:hypothetical protein